MRRGEPKLPGERVRELTEKHHEEILAKCHPAIFELAQCYKESVAAVKKLGETPRHEAVRNIQANFYGRTEDILRKYSGKTAPEPGRLAALRLFSEEVLRGEALENQNAEGGIVEYIHFHRHAKPLKNDVQKAQAKDWDASRRIQRTVADREQLRCGEGPIRPFKTDQEHWDMFAGLWNFGVGDLTPAALADFFDEYCPCGLAPHDPDALQKQRYRFRRALGF